MRVKSQPRHLPRRSPPLVETVAFADYDEMLRKMGPVEGLPLRAAIKEEEEPAREQSCLYRMMTDPDLVRRLTAERRAAGSATNAECPYCKRRFSNEAEVKDHLQQLQNGVELKCCACGKSFAQRRYLRYHQRSHSERSLYSCLLCSKKYSRHDNLTRHKIFHTNPTKFPCQHCDRSFARKDLLNKHLKCHENKFKFHCSPCGKYFKGAVTLRNHRRLFHGRVSAGSS